MDRISISFYNLRFENAFLKKTGTEFENWFADLASHAFGSDFERIRAYGRIGDWKCDGRQFSTGRIFQCYAPETQDDKKIITKMDKDFAGALNKWPVFMQAWIFVHNDSRGVPPTVANHMDKMRKANPSIQFEIWEQERLFRLFQKLNDDAKLELFGPVPTETDVNNLALPDLKPVIDELQRQEPDPTDPAPIPPSAKKLQKNELSRDAVDILQTGRRKVALVDKYFQKTSVVELGERIAEAFRARYSELVSDGRAPDAIFRNLQTFAGAMDGEPKQQAAAMAVMAYFFDSCDIFEDPDDKVIDA